MRSPWVWPAIVALLAAVPLRAADLAVRGRVLGADKKPLAGAAVTVSPLLDTYAAESLRLRGEAVTSRRSETDGEGFFVLSVPDVGMWLATASHAGFVPMELPLVPLLESRVLPTVELPRDLGLRVELVDEGGKPVAGARLVEVEPPLDARYMIGWQAARAEATSDASGVARLERRSGQPLRVLVTAGSPPLILERELGGPATKLRLTAGHELLVEVVEEGGRPVRDALVLAGSGQEGVAVTDEAGHAVVRLSAVLETTLHAQDRLGRARSRVTRRLAPADPASRPRLRFELPPATPVEGRVLDLARREPLPGAWVWSSARPGGAVRTDERGIYRFPHRGRGFSGLGAAAPGYLEALALPSSEQATTIGLERAASLRGRAVSEDGQPVAGAEIVAESKGERPGLIRRFSAAPEQDRAVSAADGRFDLRALVPATPYEIEGSKAGYTRARVRASSPAAAEASASPVELVFERGRSATGLVVDLEEQPVAGAEVRLREQTDRLWYGLIPSEDTDAATGISDELGRFEVPNVAAGRYELVVRRAGFAEAIIPGIEIAAGAGSLELGTVILEPGVGVAGQVVTARGEPVALAAVRVAPTATVSLFMLDFAGSSEDPDSLTEADGWFLLPDRRAGERIDLVVSREGFRSAIASNVEVPVAEPLRLVLEESSSVSGRVIDGDGEPLAEVTVHAAIRQEVGGGRAVASLGSETSDEQGCFRFDDVGVGALSLNATKSGWQRASLDLLALSPGEHREVELVLEPGHSLEGRVLAPDGEPAAQAFLQAAARDGTGDRRDDIMSIESISDFEGSYRIEGLPAAEVTIVVRHDEHGTVTKTVAIEPGENRLDLAFPHGFPVAGLVLDETGAPVAGVVLRLYSALGGWPPKTGESGEDGAFAFEQVSPGEHRVLAEHREYALAEPLRLHVEAPSLAGVEVRLEKTVGEISGRILNVEAGDLPGLEIVAAEARGARRRGTVDYAGSYRVVGLTSGEWRVGANLPDGRQAESRATLEAGVPVAVVDLEFGAGLSLGGRVTLGDQPLSAATVTLVWGTMRRGTTTDQGGRFRLSGLERNTYLLSVEDSRIDLRHSESLELVEDLELDLALDVTRLAGTVVDAETLEPVSGAGVRLQPVTEIATPALLRPVAPRAETDTTGRFLFPSALEGAARVIAKAAGYAATERIVELVAGEAEEIELRLTPTPETELRFERPGGAGSGQLYPQLAFLDANGRAVVAGSYETDERGLVRISTLPAGRWLLLASAMGTATEGISFVSPGPPLTIVLRSEARLDVRVPALVEENLPATLSIASVSGTPYRAVRWQGQVWNEWPLYAGRTTVSGLAPGAWLLRATAPDGRSWSGQVTAVSGQTVTVDLEDPATGK